MSIGIMQGRLSNKSGDLQSFPWDSWTEEFSRASLIGFDRIEWLIDGDSISKNPIASIEGRKKISELKSKYKLSVTSLCAHALIDGNLLSSGYKQLNAKKLFFDILSYAIEAEIEYVILPIMDAMSLKNQKSKTKLQNILFEGLLDNDIKILLESDLPAIELKDFIEKIDNDNVGILYDLGNATALGFDIENELEVLLPYIFEIHIKDRFSNNGSSARLGNADTGFDKAAKALKKLSWRGPFILETPILDNWKSEALANFAFSQKFINSISEDLAKE